MGLIFLDNTLQLQSLKTFTWPQTDQSSNKHNMQIHKEGKWYRYAEWEKNQSEILITCQMSLNFLGVWATFAYASVFFPEHHKNMPSWHDIMTKHRTKIAMTPCQADIATTAHHAKIFATHQQIAMHFKLSNAFLALMASLLPLWHKSRVLQHCTRRVENIMISYQTDINEIATTHPAKIAMATRSRLGT